MSKKSLSFFLTNPVLIGLLQAIVMSLFLLKIILLSQWSQIFMYSEGLIGTFAIFFTILVSIASLIIIATFIPLYLILINKDFARGLRVFLFTGFWLIAFWLLLTLYMIKSGPPTIPQVYY